MSKSNSHIFRQILDGCSDPSSPAWQRWWKLFIERYKNYIYKVVLDCCGRMRNPRIKAMLQEIVDDIVIDVFIKLTEKECKALRDFRERDLEPAFLSWLGIICRRMSHNRLKKIDAEPLVDGDYDDFKEVIRDGDPMYRMRLFEDIEKVLRTMKANPHDIERDIHIFKLYIWEDFTTEMILATPCFRELGDRVVDNVILRLRKWLRKNRDSI